MKRILLFSVMIGLILSPTAMGKEIGFIEEFALADDRSVPLSQLIPGTEDYYYYNCLHLQNTGRLDEVEKFLTPWIKRYNRTARVHEIEYRQALLNYSNDPEGSLEFIRIKMGLNLNHQRELLDKKSGLRTFLEQKWVSRENLTERAFSWHKKTLEGFEDSALDWLVTIDLSPERRRHLLERLTRPDYENLPQLIVDDLNWEHSRGFGSMTIHSLLLLPQLEECLRLKPMLLNETYFVNAYLTKLRPTADEDWRHDTVAREAYLDRLWNFVKRLNPSHNSLKAHVLYHRLLHDRALGIYDKERFMDYIKLPRNVAYINRDYINRRGLRGYWADLKGNYESQTKLPPIGQDEELVRSYLQHFFVSEESYDPYATYINDIYLKELFAETKIVNGLGDMEQWYSWLPPEKYRALKERVDIDFAHENKTLFEVDDEVRLDLYIKNVKTLIVKVFEINAFNYYLEHLKDIDTAINLDGLVPNEEEVYTYDMAPLRRVKRTFTFPALNTRGMYVVEFIGNGKSSRALIHKGRFRYLERLSVAGHVFTVLDEHNIIIPNARIWLSGHEYPADKDGTITVPYSTNPGRQPFIIVHDAAATLNHFQHKDENYSLVAGIFVDREELLKRTTAQVTVRPALYINGALAPLSILEQPELVITSVDREGISTTKEVKDFTLHMDRESTYEFKVPENLSSILFVLKAKVENISKNEKIDLSDSASFTINEIDKTEKVEDLHLSRIDGKYVLDVLCKTGVRREGRPVQIRLKHRDFKDEVDLTRQTDKNGRITLGALKDVVWIKVKGPEETEHTWHLVNDMHSYPSLITGREGETILVPYMGDANEPLRSELSLLEKRGGTFTKDFFNALSIENGFVKISSLPAGNFNLLLKKSNTLITLWVTKGQEKSGNVILGARNLEVKNEKPLQISSVATDETTLTIQLEHSSPYSRVHVIATSYLPAFSPYDTLGRILFPGPSRFPCPRADSLYVSGRKIGDEYRYIIDRKYTAKYPGNMLTRPGLLINPWELRKTEAGKEALGEGEAWDRRGEAEADGMARPQLAPPRPVERLKDFANLDFLADQSVVLLNLVPDKNGKVAIARETLGAHQHIHILAVDPENTVYREVSLPEIDPLFRDLRLANGLDPEKHFTEQKQISVVKNGEEIVIPDVTTSKFELYDNLAKVYALYLTLNNNPNLIEFNFILDWPEMKDEEKREKYSKYACHELNLFLYHKDPVFFEKVVQSYLRNKKDKTFVDHWLIGNDLSGYLTPWEFEQLNIVERILLAQRISEEKSAMTRHVKDLFNLIPPDIDRFNHLFKTALKGSALEAGKPVYYAGYEDKAVSDFLYAPSKGTLSEGDVYRVKQGARKKRLAALEAKAAPEAIIIGDKEESADLAFFGRDEARRRGVRAYYRKLDKTSEWAENNYYHLPIEQQNASLVTVNTFWNDYAAHLLQNDGALFYSVNLADASRSFTEMMFALAVLDIPYVTAEHHSEFEEAKFSLKAASPLVIYHKEIKTAKEAEVKIPILVSQNFYKHDDRYTYRDNEKIDKFVTEEFVIHTVYGCQVVVTNPTSSRQKLDVLLQVPHGAIPVLNGKYTHSVHIALEPYNTKTFDYYFYFPASGEYKHYPVHVAQNEDLIAYSTPFIFNVVEKPTIIDKTSWGYISQYGSGNEVISFLKENNINRIKIKKIAWRMKEQGYFNNVLSLLEERHTYDHTLWSYGIKHNDVPRIRQFLQHEKKYLQRCGDYIDSPLLTIDPVVRKTYQHLEYSPLVNARIHPLGGKRTILNDRLYNQYTQLMKVLSYRPAFDDDDLMSITYYMLLQDRIEEAFTFFKRVDPEKLSMRLQYDYMNAYMDFFTEDHKTARQIAEKYADYPVDRWRKVFGNVLSQLDEIEGEAPSVLDDKDRTQTQTQLASTEPSFDFKVEEKKVRLDYQNIAECRVNYYLMDIEFLFSRNPFVQEFSGQFSIIRPNATGTHTLPEDKTEFVFDLPKEFHSSNVLVEIVAGGITKSQAYYSHSLALQVIENYGQVKVTHTGTGKPLPKVYVKVFAKMKNGEVQFYKDGYTDLRGRFDYTSLNTNELDFVEKFSLLVMSDEHGAVVREAAPPKR